MYICPISFISLLILMPNTAGVSRVAAELFDLTVTTRNSKFGCLKDNYAEAFGPFQPLRRFISEYEMFEADDKSAKRATRLSFLGQVAAQSEHLRKWFMCVTAYLNGYVGSRTRERTRTPRPCIACDEATCAPPPRDEARIVTTVLDALQDIWLDLPSECLEPTPAQIHEVLSKTHVHKAPFRVCFAGGNIIAFFAQVLKALFARWGLNAAPDLVDAAEKVRRMALSDLDFALLPSTPSEYEAATGVRATEDGRAAAGEGEGEGEGGVSGFALFRAKTVISESGQPAPRLPELDAPAQDAIRALFETTAYVSPQSFQTAMLNEYHKKYGGKEWYKAGQDYLEHLSGLKDKIEAGTRANTLAVGKQHLGLRADTTQVDDSLIAFSLMSFVHERTALINKLVEVWPRMSCACLGGRPGPCGASSGPTSAAPWAAWAKGQTAHVFWRRTMGSIASLRAADNPIPRLCTSILLLYIQWPVTPMEAVADAAADAASSAARAAAAAIAPSKVISLAFPSEAAAIRAVNYTDFPMPDGINTTLNLIETGTGTACEPERDGRMGGGARRTRRRRVHGRPTRRRRRRL